ncbi:MAG: carboxylating nicotinate-nucleotide diphosphorylase [Arenicella sp.]
MMPKQPRQAIITQDVLQCIEEDVKQGDLTAQLLPVSATIDGKIISRESGIICGLAWAEEAFRIIDKTIEVDWQVNDGDAVHDQTVLCKLQGNARQILTAERQALNLLQTLSGTATVARQYVDAIKHTKAKLLDTRKTIPGLRDAQKYAVLCGGGNNHRMGLYDGILIKENHLRCGKSLTNVVKTALNSVPEGTLVELEVETIEQMQQGIDAGIQRVLLDNFTLEELKEAVAINADRIDLEASGNVAIDTIAAIAETGVDYISSGAITKHVRALDLSLLFDLTV